MGRDASATRERLIEAGTRLFAEHGIDAVRVREINTEAGQRNSSALHYHFGSREGLLQAILAEHRGPMERHRAELLDALEREGRTDDLRALVATMVLPLMAELSTASGRAYLRIIPQYIGRYSPSFSKLPKSYGPDGIRRTVALSVACLGHLPDDERETRVDLTMEYVTYAVARRARDIDEGVPLRLPEERFVSAVLDLAVGGLGSAVTFDAPPGHLPAGVTGQHPPTD
jgi:hypothetical protein